MADTSTAPDGKHQIVRKRRETRRRQLEVSSVAELSPTMRRIVFHSDDLHDFESDSHDDHVKLFVPDADGQEHMRDYTPRSFDPVAGSLTIDFAIHEAGPATNWASEARAGDRISIGGPRGSAIVPDDFDWYLFCGDETALPAIGRRLEELRPDARSYCYLLVDGPDCELKLGGSSHVELRWIHRNGSVNDDAAAFEAALADWTPPAGDGFAFIAAETEAARRMRELVEARGHNPAWLKSKGYWTR
jgi:NADPH-dependent ferric siderophore reductase